MNNRTERSKWLGSFVQAPEGTARRELMLAKGSSALADPRLGPMLKASFEQYTSTVVAQQESGAGLLADEQLRYFQRDYHHRFIERGAQYLPTSYRTAEAFFQSRREAPGFYLLPERDYQFSFTDFLDYITGPGAPTATLGLGYGFVDGQIYNITSTDPLGELLLETQGEGAYAVRAASLVRRGDELVIMLVLGEHLTADRLLDITSDTLSAGSVNPTKPDLSKSLHDAIRKPAYINDTGLLQTTALVRFNVKELRLESRCLLRDLSDMFRTWTDDLDAFGKFIDPDSPGFRNMVAELDACDAIWEVAKTLTLFSSYLAAKVEWTMPRKERTALGKVLPASLKKQRELKEARQQDKVLFRTISSISASKPTHVGCIDGRAYRAPQFQVAVEGFWRTFAAPEQKGRSPSGEEVLGRTWVRSHIRHKDKALPVEQKVVYIKASLSEARSRLERYRKRARQEDGAVAVPLRLEVELPALSENSEISGDGKSGAFVYIMRCHAHSQNLFKVGFTDRDPETRAKELSAATASPLPFMVLHAWAVSDGHAAERSAHAALAEIRLSGNREFFLLAYEALRDKVHAAVTAWILNS